MALPLSNLAGEGAELPACDEKILPGSGYHAANIDERVILEFEEVRQVKQGLHQQQIQMIALAGTIGTGLFLGSGKAIARSGPFGAFLAYSIVGGALFSVVLAVGEMGARVPLNGGIVRHAENLSTRLLRLPTDGTRCTHIWSRFLPR